MRIPRRSLALLAVLAACGSLGMMAGLGIGLLPGGADVPVLEYTEFVDLGAHEQRSIAVGRFQVKNAGRGLLVLDQFRTNCACAGVEREVDGKFLLVESVRLRGGEQVELVVRGSVAARAGERQRIGCTFETNDPARPRAFVEALILRVLGGVVTLPTAVLCGSLPLSASAKHVLDVYDGGQAGRRIKTVRSTQPQRFSASLLPTGSADAPARHEMAGGLIGQVEITPITTREGPLDGEVEIVLADEDRRPDLISVTGRVMSSLGVTPGSVLLPRKVEGQPVYHAKVRIWSHEGKPVSVRVESADKDLPVVVLPHAQGTDERHVRIEWKPASNNQASKTQTRRVRLLVRVGEEEHVRDIHVVLHETGR